MKNFVKHIINFFKYIVLGAAISIMTLCAGVTLLLIITLLLSVCTAPSYESLAVLAMVIVNLLGAVAWYDLTEDLRKAFWR